MMKEQKEKPIGVMDSGSGGLTVVRELERLLPMENVVYFGDTANCPYGNRPREEILELSLTMLDFLRKREVKAVSIACNTISILAGELRQNFDFPIFSIIENACEYVASLELAQTAVFATEFTISQGLYTKLLKKLRPEAQVFGIASRTLARLVEEGRFSESVTEAEIHSMLNRLKETHPEVKNIVLGCTHYPIVQDQFERAAPQIVFINPAIAHAEAVKALLTERGLLNNTLQPSLEIFTSGEKSVYDAAVKKLGIKRKPEITTKIVSANSERSFMV